MRRAPVAAASTTSFTVHLPSVTPAAVAASLIALTRARETRTSSQRRWADTAAFHGISGARWAAGASGSTDLTNSAERSTARWGVRSTARADRTSSAGSLSRSTTLSISSSSDVGAGSGCQRGGSTGVGSGVRSNRTVATSSPETPSTMQWWVLEMIATRSPSTPSTNQSSQSGRRRSSGWDWSRPISVLSCSSLPGVGRAVRRMW